ncbi:C40 family peptidase [Gordonia sp. HY285]|uniref:C40 family peptidase n=1 Tax=Gordonia liuliyuniae TaxID=2911517 RepID=A0ABS9IUS9_9ACTN|nr:C40 family peptidase [Gordonia liuliyuniae]MCF8589320.1 C40 family peptidase [Gordonia liuliyuniae]MCF8611283.1 C40 family peptidase [Gordonia liuliyuniae]
MAKHRLDKPGAGRKVATTAVVAGSIAIGGSLALAAGPADAAPINIPGVGKFDVPENLLPKVPKVNPQGPIGTPQQVRAQKALHYAESKIGSPYVYGASGPSAFDCSGLTSWAYRQAGKTIPRDSYGQMGGGTSIASLAAARPGDVLVFNGGGHVGLYAGNGMFVHASTEGVPVKRDKVKNWSVTSIRRY